MGFQSNAFQQTAFQGAGAFSGAGSSRGRRLAFVPVLDVGIRAREPMRFRRSHKRIPDSIVEKRRLLRLTSKTELSTVNSASYGAQTQFEQIPTIDGGLPRSLLGTGGD